MNTTRMIEIANLMGGHIKARTTCTITISHLTADIEGRKVAITPEGGWPGKNAEDRKFAEAVTLAADEPIKAMRGELLSQQDQLACREAEITVLEAERRALEWSVRAALVDALAGKRENAAPIDEAGFDDAAQAAADESLFATEPAFVDDFPF